MDDKGVFSDRDIIKFIDGGGIVSEKSVEISQIQPSSLDLRLGNRILSMRCSSISYDSIERHFEEYKNYEFSLDKGGYLPRGTIYIAEIIETLSLPPNILAKANPKSSTGRVDTHVRLLTEEGGSFDRVPPGYNGRLFLEIYPRSFDIKLRKNDTLNQLRFYDIGTEQLPGQELISLHRRGEGLLLDERGKLNIENIIEGETLSIHLDLMQEKPAYIARRDAPHIDWSKRNLPFSDYFDPVRVDNRGVIIDTSSFYLLVGLEIINIPMNHCAEMSDVRTESGEYRAHYAGFFDPRFRGKPVLELRNTGAPFLLTHKQRIANLGFYRLKSEPLKGYGKEIGSSYQGQSRIRPAKFFA